MKRNFILLFAALFLVLEINAQTISPTPYCVADFDYAQ